MLARDVKEAEAHARLAGLAMHNVIIPQTPGFIHSLKLKDRDLIVEFPSFADHPHEVAIRQGLHTVLRMCKANPPWERLGS
jgi:hypothetical protein